MLAGASFPSFPGTSRVADSAGTGPTLTIANVTPGPWACDFNPYKPSSEVLSFGPVYEPLEFVDTMDNATVTPMLATGYAWSTDNFTLTFTLRSGAHWDNGSPFSAADVVYSFELLKQHPALDANSVWSVLSTVASQGSNRVVFSFRRDTTGFPEPRSVVLEEHLGPSVPSFYYIADQVPIVSEQVWSKVADPATYRDAKPVGTGPYVVAQCNTQGVTYQKNPGYWQPGLPYVQTVEYPALSSDRQVYQYLATGKAQWGSLPLAEFDAALRAEQPNYQYWAPPLRNLYLFMNLTVPPFNVYNAYIRPAIAYAIDRAEISKVGEAGLDPPANQSGIVTPTFNSWYDPSMARVFNYTYRPAWARQLLAKAGYKPGPGGIDVSAAGAPLSFSLLNVGANADWAADVHIIQSQLKAVGISVTIDNLPQSDFLQRLSTGRFQLAYYYVPQAGPTPYYELRSLLYSPNAVPVGQVARSNYERYRDLVAYSNLDCYASSKNPAVQRGQIYGLQSLMLAAVPVVPVVELPDPSEYDSGRFSGWATPSNPYAEPAVYNVPDWGVQLAHLQVKS
jgi:peptide/nickel transport system substrate-binding protein